MRQYLVVALCVVLCSIFENSKGQSSLNPKTDTIKWEYGKIENRKRSEMLTLSGHLISYGDNGFLWVQNGTDKKYRFEVKSVKGLWLNVNEQGELIYKAVCQEVDGTIRVFRDRRNVKIQLDFSQPDKLTPNIMLEVNSIHKL